MLHAFAGNVFCLAQDEVTKHVSSHKAYDSFDISILKSCTLYIEQPATHDQA